MQFFEHYGLGFFMETEENFINFTKKVLAEGRSIVGYYGRPYINAEFGWPQFIVRTQLDEETKKLDISGLDTHLSGIAEWTFRVISELPDPDNDDVLSKRVIACKPSTGKGIAVVNLINADVLPSFLPGDVINAQMVGFPLNINYYDTEKDYFRAHAKNENDKQLLLANGKAFPIGLLEKNEENNDGYSNNYMLIRGTVKQAQLGLTKFGKTKSYDYVDVVINTEFGDLEIVHTLDQVEKSQRNLIRVDSIVSGVFVLSGDVAIRAYKDGFISDKKHNLALLRYTLQSGDPERLRFVLSENIEYYSESSNKTFVGIDDVINRFKHVRESNPDTRFFAHFAKITSVKKGDKNLPYKKGDDCIIIAMREEDKAISICFIENDLKNKISKIHVTTNPRYRFRIKKKLD